MITVQGLSKQYGSTTALSDVNFSIKRGEVLGFLGPNGAGKSTTMRIIAGLLYPSAGQVELDGERIFPERHILRRRIGYLPENNPLYDTMRVYEYLEYVAGVKQVANAVEDIRRVVADTALQEKVRAPIASLSKGYRQRVGLAAALLGNPDLLILDEPTSGLDPNQAAEVRKLIRSIGQEKTVLFSSHMLAEAQESCDRVLIIRQGEIVAEGEVDVLLRGTHGTTIAVEIAADAADNIVIEALEAVDAVESVTATGSQQFSVVAHGDADPREAIFRLCVDNGWVLLGLSRTEARLEDVFRELTA